MVQDGAADDQSPRGRRGVLRPGYRVPEPSRAIATGRWHQLTGDIVEHQETTTVAVDPLKDQIEHLISRSSRSTVRLMA